MYIKIFSNQEKLILKNIKTNRSCSLLKQLMPEIDWSEFHTERVRGKRSVLFKRVKLTTRSKEEKMDVEGGTDEEVKVEEEEEVVESAAAVLQVPVISAEETQKKRND